MGKISVIITGVTGMVGEGVLHECLLSPDVERVLVLSRRPYGNAHPKMTEIIVPDFFDLSAIESRLAGYDACFFCLGVSSVGLKKPEYEKLTYDLTIGFAKTLAKVNPKMTFCYISGAGTDSTEKGKLHWARIKGKTENDLQKIGFSKVYCFRPGMLKATPGLKNTLPLYKWFSWLAPVLSAVAPNSISRLSQLGKAMIHAATDGFDQPVVNVRDINQY